jgi:hypothetical protein
MPIVMRVEVEREDAHNDQYRGDFPNHIDDLQHLLRKSKLFGGPCDNTVIPETGTGMWSSATQGGRTLPHSKTLPPLPAWV